MCEDSGGGAGPPLDLTSVAYAAASPRSAVSSRKFDCEPVVKVVEGRATTFLGFSHWVLSSESLSESPRDRSRELLCVNEARWTVFKLVISSSLRFVEDDGTLEINGWGRGGIWKFGARHDWVGFWTVDLADFFFEDGTAAGRRILVIASWDSREVWMAVFDSKRRLRSERCTGGQQRHEQSARKGSRVLPKARDRRYRDTSVRGLAGGEREKRGSALEVAK